MFSLTDILHGMLTLIEQTGAEALTSAPPAAKANISTGIANTRTAIQALGSTALSTVGQVAQAAPALAGTAAGDFVGMVASEIPGVGPIAQATGITPELESFASVLVSGLAQSFENSLERHNKNTIAAITAAVGGQPVPQPAPASPPAPVSGGNVLTGIPGS